MVYSRMFLLSSREIGLSIFLCTLLIHQFTGSPIEHPAAVSELTGIKLTQSGLDETVDFINTTDAVVVARSRARRQQSTTTQCSSNLRLGTDEDFQKKIAMSDSGDVTVVSTNCSNDTIVEQLYAVRPGLIRIRFQRGYLGVAGTKVSTHNIENPGTIEPNDVCLWCETGNSEHGFRFRYFSPSMAGCTDDQEPEQYMTVTETDDVIVSPSSSRNMNTFFRECDNQCT